MSTDNLPKAAVALIDFVRSENDTKKNYLTLHFVFHPNCASDIGIGAQWGSALQARNQYTNAAGWTLEEAAENLLDMILHPEKYPKSSD